MINALVIRTAGDKAICNSIGAAFESPELRKLKLQSTVLRRNREELRRAEIAAIRQEVETLMRRHERRKRILCIIPNAVQQIYERVSERKKEGV